MKDVDWCCASFRNRYSLGGKRGVAVVYGVSDGELQFFLQFRAVKAGVERLSGASEVPLSLLEQVLIDFCPWCSKRLERYYRKQVDKLPILSRPIQP
jgi:hypothetical protein